MGNFSPQKYSIALALWLWCLSVLAAHAQQAQLDSLVRSFPGHVGYKVVALPSGTTLAEHQAHQFFQPASTQKLLTTYLALHTLPDYLTAYKFLHSGNTFVLKPTGYFGLAFEPFSWHTIPLTHLGDLEADSIHLIWEDSYEGVYPPGWSWEDYGYSFAVERGPLPLFGNRVQVTQWGDSLAVRPAEFASQVLADPDMKPGTSRRLLRNNYFFFGPSLDSVTFEIPYSTGSTTTQSLLAELTGKTVLLSTLPNGYQYPWRKMEGVARDSALAYLLHESDNFVAEQLLYSVSDQLNKGLQPDSALAKGRQLVGQVLPDSVVWVDGSGLSRYNLTTPANLVALVDAMYYQYGLSRLQLLLPQAGLEGTLNNPRWASWPLPTWAKTGSFSNTYCLAGVLQVPGGDWRAFSIMLSLAPHGRGALESFAQELLRQLAALEE